MGTPPVGGGGWVGPWFTPPARRAGPGEWGLGPGGEPCEKSDGVGVAGA
jgi:hypothetical protein